MRKLLFTLLVLLLTYVSEAQSPYFFNYQGVARNSVGNAVVNRKIGLRLTIRDGSALGIPVYTETRVVTTNNFGLFNVQVGGAGATNVAGSIASTIWNVGSKWMQVEIDPEGSNTFKDVGNTQLISVPYSLYSNLTGDIVLPFVKSQNEEVPLFKLTNTGNGANSLAYEGFSSSTANNATVIRGVLTSVNPGSFSSAVSGRNNGTGINGFGIYGYQNGAGSGVYGETPDGVGVYGNSITGIGVYGQSLASSPSIKGFKSTVGLGHVGFFENTNNVNSFAALRVQTNGPGDATNVNMTGLGKGGVFTINNTGNTANLMEFTTNGTGSVNVLSNTNAGNASNILDIRTNGMGRIGFLQSTNASNGVNAFEVQAAGIGRTAFLQSTNAGNPSNVLEIQNNGLGKVGYLLNTNPASGANALEVLTQTIGRAGLFTNTNPANPSNLFEVQTNGIGKTGLFQNTNAANAANVLEVQTNGLNRVAVLENTNISNASNVLDARTNGTGRVGFLQNTNTSNNANVVEVQTNGTGRAVLLQNSNAVNTSNVLEVQTNGIGKVGVLQNTNAANAANVFDATTNGTGRVGVLSNTNAANASNVLDATTNGTGRVGFMQNTNTANAANILEVQTNGLGKVEVLQNTNAANASNVFDARTNGTGRVGFLQNTNAGNTSNILEVQTSGTGRTGFLQNTNAVNAANVLEVQTNGTGKVGVLENTNAANASNVLDAKTAGTGRVGFFQNTNAVNAANVLEVQTNGVGKVGVLENTNAGNPNNTLDVKTAGTGRVGFLQNTNASNGANTLEVQSNGTGKVAFFQATNATSAANALHATSNGSGYTTFIQNTNANPLNRKAILTNGSVFINDPTQSLDSITGALVIRSGGLGLEGNLNVGGSAAFSGDVSFKSPVLFLSPLESTGPTVGAVTVVGGVGIGKRLNVTGDVAFSNALTVGGATTLNSTATIAGVTTINNTLNVNASSSFVANFVNSTNANGISIQVGSASVANANNFVEFRNSSGTVVGRIEGETQAELESTNNDYKAETRQYEGDIAFGAIDVAAGAYDVAVAGVDLAASLSSATPCVGFGACITSPIPSFIIAAGTKLAAAIIKEAATVGALIFTTVNFDTYKSQKASEIGVTYQSGSGDYAEYLMKANLSETFKPGDIVAVKGGKISKNLDGAERIMAISTKPIVLGNVPRPEDEKSYEKVAFLGQVPVKVFGKVNVGDYIIPNGNNNGVGKAVAPSEIKSAEIKNILGIAWSGSMEANGISIINVAIGINVNDNQKMVDELQSQVSDLKGQLADINSKLDKFLNDPKTLVSADVKKNIVTTAPVSTPGGIVPTEDIANAVLYHHVTRDEVLQFFVSAEKQMRDEGTNIETHPVWSQYKNNPAFRDALVNKIMTIAEKGIEDAKKLNTKRIMR